MEKNNQIPSFWTGLRDSTLIASAVLTGAIALGYSFIWYLQRHWGISGNFCQFLWDDFLLHFGDDEFTLIVFGTTIWVMIVYWAVGSVYVFLDWFNWPQWIRKYKIQPGTNEPVDSNRLLSVIGQVLFNQIVVGFVVSATYFWFKPTQVDIIHSKLPSFSRLLVELSAFVILEEMGFYYAHRLLHHPLLYKNIHKKHHQWTAPIAITAIYCHPIEHFLSNMIPLVLGPTIMSSHLVVSWLWYAIAIFTTLNDHSGYHFPGFRSPEAHDFHHLKFTECYGVLGILDYIHGTDKMFRSSAPYRRHFMFWTLKPMRIQIPDDPIRKTK